MILEKIKEILKKRNFISIATADKQCVPHAAPKFLLKIDGSHVYLIDYAIAKTVENLRVNPLASMSFMDLDNLEGYRLSGHASLLEEGEDFKKILEAFDKKLIKLSADRLIEGMKSGKQYEHFELEIPSRVIIIKLKVDEVVRIGRQGELFKESL